MKTNAANHFLLAIVGSTMGLIFAPSKAHAALQFSDSFAYDPGALVGNGPPTGSPLGQTGWTNYNGSTQVTSSGLSFAGDLSLGNKATTRGTGAGNGDIATANLSQAGGGAGIEWLGFLISEASGGATPNGFAVLGFGGGNGPGIGMLFNLNVYGIDNDNGTQAITSTGVNASTVMLVTKFDFNTGMEYIFVNPSTASEPSNAQAGASIAMTSSFKASGFNQLVLAQGSNTASFNFDELRVGTTFADVVPEPSTGVLLVSAATALLGFRRRCNEVKLGSEG